jgi:hypothetical protein
LEFRGLRGYPNKIQKLKYLEQTILLYKIKFEACNYQMAEPQERHDTTSHREPSARPDREDENVLKLGFLEGKLGLEGISIKYY